MTALAPAPDAARSNTAMAPALMKALQFGIECHSADKLAEAEQAYAQVLEGHPQSFEALHFLSILRMQQNRFRDALQPATAAVRAKPSSADALSVLGVVFANLDRHGEAIGAFDRALAVRPDSLETVCNRAASLAKLGRTEEAALGYRRALALRPGHPAALLNLGNNLAALGRYQEALSCYGQLLQQGIATPDLANNLGNVLFEIGRPEDALTAYAQALTDAPNHLDAMNNSGRVLTSLDRHHDAIEYHEKVLRIAPAHAGALTLRGRALVKLERHLDALGSFDAALAIEPDSFTTIIERCVALQHLYRFDEALAGAERALALDPGDPAAHYHHGNVLQALNRCEEAVAAYQTMLGMVPGGADAIARLGEAWLGARPAGVQPPVALSFTFSAPAGGETAPRRRPGAEPPSAVDIVRNLGAAWLGMERYEETIACCELAFALGADDDKTKSNKSFACLNLGRFAEGWADYDSRLNQSAWRAYSQPRWDGEQVDGTLLVWGEQGLGDQIIYASMVEEAAFCAASVVLEVEPRLVPLFHRSFPMVEVVGRKREPYAGPITAHTPIGSLGRHLRPDWDSFPRREEGFLRADPVRTAELRERLADGRRIVGLSWRSKNPKLESLKTAQLRDFEALLRLPNCRFIDLQYGDTSEERAAVERELGIRIENLPDIDNKDDIDGLAALISACDQVVTVSNTTAHLAGALGRDTIVLLQAGHGRPWYWFKDRADSPWYPRVQLVRLKQGEPWAAAIEGVAQALR